MRESQQLLRAALACGFGVVLQAISLGTLAAEPVTADLTSPDPVSKIHGALRSSEGIVEVSIRLSQPSAIELAGKGAKHAPGQLNRQAQRAQLAGIKAQQDRVAAEVARAGGRELARVSKVLNAVVVSIDASALPQIAALAEVRSVTPIARYETHLSETVPYIGAAAAQSAGVDGTGVKVAVLDTGIDYTHKNLGGPGTLAAYKAAWGTGPGDPRPTKRDGLFPTAKVVEGYDFIGENWPDSPPAPDDDPIDSNGHGTHVADIIGGRSADGTHVGVAPGITLYAYKVCSAISTACSGVAILQGLDAALDPNHDGDIRDAVDVVNMSLGSIYGQIADDSSAATQNLTDFGVVVVVSAGNSGDKPYVVGAPSIAPGAISVAETHVPSARSFVITLDGSGVPNPPVEIGNTASVDWAPVDVAVDGPVVLASGPGALGCTPYPPGTDFTGKVVLINRGNCAVSLKVDFAAQFGAAGVLIANNVPGDPPTFIFGGGSVFVPTLVISQADGNRIKTWLTAGTVEASFGPDAFVPLGGSVVSTSSRGPSYDFDTIKPDISAPGASRSAQAGTGDLETAFGGTSGAAPMVSGSAALVLQKFPSLLPHEVKARLMNTADANLLINPVALPGVLAPITRVGAGEVRVDRALNTGTLAYDAESGIASLSFGYRALGAFGEPLKFKRKVHVQNLGSSKRTYSLSAGFRDAADAALGAVSISFSPPKATLNPGKETDINVFLEVIPTKLPAWTLNSGAAGGNGERLRQLEFDGYVTLESGDQRITLPWHLLPHRAADSQLHGHDLDLKNGHGSFAVRNHKGATPGVTDFFALTGLSPVDYPLPPAPGSQEATPDLAAVGLRYLPDLGGLLQFAVATHDERSHANYPAELDIYVDTTGDDQIDYVIATVENGGPAATGQNVTALFRFPSFAPVGTFFFTDADLNSQTAILTVPLAAMRVRPDHPIAFLAVAFDNYFTGALTDFIDDQGDFMRFTPNQPRFSPGSRDVSVDPGGSANIPVTYQPAGDAASPSQIGILALHRDAKPGAWWSVLPVKLK